MIFLEIVPTLSAQFDLYRTKMRNPHFCSISNEVEQYVLFPYLMEKITDKEM